MSQVNTNSIYDASGGSNAVLYGVAAPANSMGFRNRIINGDMRIDQRNAGAVVNADNSYPVDRFQMGKAGSQTFTAQRSTTAPTGFTNSLAITIGTGSAPAATDRLTVAQAIEGFNVSDLGWGTANALAITVSFQVRSSLTGTFGVAFRNAGGTRSYVSSFTISAANTFETKTLTIPGDTSGVWAVDNAAGLYWNLDLGCGSTFSTTAGSWQAGNFLGLTGGVKLNATSGATFYITGVQLEAGSVASPFERRDYGRELMMCQRYYEKSYLSGDVPGTATSAATLTVIAYVSTETNGFTWQVQKRTTPTVTLYNSSGTSGQIGGNSNAATAGYLGEKGCGYIGRTGNTVGSGYYLHYVASAEL